MTTVDYLEKQYDHAFEMVKFSESKNTSLIAFNGAIIIGLAQLINNDLNTLIYWYLIFITCMCTLSIFICLSSMVAKIKHTTHNTPLHRSNNLLFYATIAQMSQDELILQIQAQYGCHSLNSNHEKDLAMQAIITSQIACRKFSLFNIAIGFTFAGILTPVSLLIYKVYFSHDN